MAKKASPAKSENASKPNQLARQINLKTAFGSLKGLDLSGGEKKLARIAGVAISIEEGHGDYGRWLRFLGNFAAINADTGVVIEATKCILPGPQGEALGDRYMAQLREDATASCKFSGDLYAVPRQGYADQDSDNFQKYDLEFRTVIAPDFQNPALELLNAA